MPHTLCIGWVVARVVGGLDVACVVTKFAAAVLVLAVCDVGGTIKIGAGVARTGDAMVLAKLGLIGAHGTADTPVGGGIVVVSGRAMHFGLAVLERGGTRVFGEQPASTGEAAGSPRLGLVCAHRAGLARLEPIR